MVRLGQLPVAALKPARRKRQRPNHQAERPLSLVASVGRCAGRRDARPTVLGRQLHGPQAVSAQVLAISPVHRCKHVGRRVPGQANEPQVALEWTSNSSSASANEMVCEVSHRNGARGKRDIRERGDVEQARTDSWIIFATKGSRER